MERKGLKGEAIATINDFKKYFGSLKVVEVKGDKMFVATINKITNFTTPGKESIKYNITSENDKTFDATAWLNGENVTEDFIERAKSLRVGDQAELSVKWTEPKTEGGRSYCNILSIMPIRDVRGDTSPPKKSAPAKSTTKKTQPKRSQEESETIARLSVIRTSAEFVKTVDQTGDLEAAKQEVFKCANEIMQWVKGLKDEA